MKNVKWAIDYEYRPDEEFRYLCRVSLYLPCEDGFPRLLSSDFHQPGEYVLQNTELEHDRWKPSEDGFLEASCTVAGNTWLAADSAAGLVVEQSLDTLERVAKENRAKHYPKPDRKEGWKKI